MKKIFIFSILAISYLTSCNKAHYCTCTINGTVDTETYTLYNTKRKAADKINAGMSLIASQATRMLTVANSKRGRRNTKAPVDTTATMSEKIPANAKP